MGDDPPHFGYQSDHSYLPSPAEILRECEVIRRGWSANEKYLRGEPRPSWDTPFIEVPPEVAAELNEK
jgi:hypothetical protein